MNWDEALHEPREINTLCAYFKNTCVSQMCKSMAMSSHECIYFE